MNMESIWGKIDKANTIGIAGHIRPDGDCTGSCMALYQYLTKEFPEKMIDVYFESLPKNFSFLQKTEEIKYSYDEKIEYDLFIALDSSDKERLGDAGKYFDAAKDTICIDHHISNLNYADMNIVDPQASSTAEVLFGLMEEEKIDINIATSLYLGIVHDSGVFKYSNTSRKTMEIAGVLVEKGVEKTKLIDNTYFRKTYVQNQILGRVLLESILVLDGKVIVSCVSKKMMNFYNATVEDLEGIVEQLRITEGVEAAIFVHELETMKYKVSMRSNEIVDVSSIATTFGGGGHVRAAGCTMTGSYYDIVNNVLMYIEKQLKDAGELE